MCEKQKCGRCEFHLFVRLRPFWDLRTTPHLFQYIFQVLVSYWVHEPWHLYDRAAAKVLSQPLVVPSGTHENDPQVRVLIQACAQQSQQQVCVYVSLVDLVNHHVADSLQGWV